MCRPLRTALICHCDDRVRGTGLRCVKRDGLENWNTEGVTLECGMEWDLDDPLECSLEWFCPCISPAEVGLLG